MITKKNKHHSGAIALITMMVLGSVITLIVISLVMLGLSARSSADVLFRYQRHFIKVDGCFEESLIQLNRNPLYSGDSYTVDGADCTVSVSGLLVKTLDMESFDDGYRQFITADVVLTPVFGILDFD